MWLPKNELTNPAKIKHVPQRKSYKDESGNDVIVAISPALSYPMFMLQPGEYVVERNVFMDHCQIIDRHPNRKGPSQAGCERAIH